MNTKHYLDRHIWDSETWVAEFNALLDAIELQWAIEDELTGDDYGAPEGGLKPDAEL